MKILFVQNIEGIAGSEKYFFALLPKLQEEGVECEFVCVNKKKYNKEASTFVTKLDELKIPYKQLTIYSYLSPLIPWFISRTYSKGNFDFLNTHLIYADFWGSIAKRFIDSKIVHVSTKHGYHEDTWVKYCLEPEKIPRNTYYYLFKYAEKKLDASYACSYGLKNFYERAKLLPNKTMKVIQHGFDYPDIKPSDQYRYGQHQLIIIGRLVHRKGHSLVFNILSKLINEFGDLHLVILGDGELRESLEKECSELQINDHVHFLGFKTNIFQYITSSDIYVVPSYSEGLPLVIFEGFNCKIPIVAFDTIGCSELIEHGQTGLIAKPFEKEDLMEKIRTLLQNSSLRKAIGEKGYERLKANFNLNRMVSDTIDFYKDLIKT